MLWSDEEEEAYELCPSLAERKDETSYDIILGTHLWTLAADKGAENDKINCRMMCVFLKMMNDAYTAYNQTSPSDLTVLSELHFPQH